MKEVNYIVSIGDCCVPAEITRNNNARCGSFIFDWAQSNLGVACDIFKNGIEWHIENNINNQTYYNHPKYQFKKLYYPHHEDTNYMVRCAERFFKVLNSDDNVIFLYMSSYRLDVEEIINLQNIILSKYPKLNFKIVAATSQGIPGHEIYHTNINEYIDTYQCNSPRIFSSNKMNDHEFYIRLFKELIPYELNIKNIYKHEEDNFPRKDETLSNTLLSVLTPKCIHCGSECENKVNCKNDDCKLLFIQCEKCAIEMKGCCSKNCIELK
jgi:hypothetical protein